MLLAYAMPAYLALLVTLAVQGAVSPWAPAREALAAHPDQVAVQVGLASSMRRAASGGLEAEKSRYYVLLPEALRHPRLLRVTQLDGGPVQVTSTRGGFVALLAALLACIAGSWAFWMRAPRGEASREQDE